MRKSYLKYIAAAAVTATMTVSCSHASLDDEGGLSAVEQMEVPMILSVLPTTDGSADIYDHGTMPDASDIVGRWESAINPKCLYIATYTKAGKLIDVLYNGGIPAINTTSTVFFDHASWGPTISFRLNKQTKTEYNSDFYIAAFSVPNTAGNSFDFTSANLIQKTLSFPASLKKEGWTLDDITDLKADGSDAFIPMAGCQLITNEWIEKTYNRDIYGVAPLQLPSIRMVRSVAKIVIEDLDEVIATATCTHNADGHLFPAPLTDGGIWWSEDFTDTPPAKPHVPSQNSAKSAQVLDTPNASRPDKADPSKEVKQFVFYLFEHDFNGKKATHEDRGIVQLTASGLPDKTIYIAPYTTDGKELKGDAGAYSEISKLDDGAWTGVLRNHCYTYSVSKPTNMGLSITVHVRNWGYKRIETEL